MEFSAHEVTCGATPWELCLYLPQGLLCQSHSWSRDSSWALDFSDTVGGSTFSSHWNFLPNVASEISHKDYFPLLGFSSAPRLNDSHRSIGLDNHQSWYEGDHDLITAADPPCPPAAGSAIQNATAEIDSCATAKYAPHRQANSNGEFVCNACSENFPHKSALDDHAKTEKHGAYKCICGITFSRHDVLDRHIHTFNRETLYPCTYCFTFSGLNAFTRRDHLTQHLRCYHKIETSPGPTLDSQSSFVSRTNAKSSGLSCPHEDCSGDKDVADSTITPSEIKKAEVRFRTRKDLTHHLREVHDESLYPCDFLGCDRTKGRGYSRNRDLLHHQNDHQIFSA